MQIKIFPLGSPHWEFMRCHCNFFALSFSLPHRKLFFFSPSFIWSEILSKSYFLIHMRRCAMLIWIYFVCPLIFFSWNISHKIKYEILFLIFAKKYSSCLFQFSSFRHGHSREDRTRLVLWWDSESWEYLNLNFMLFFNGFYIWIDGDSNACLLSWENENF